MEILDVSCNRKKTVTSESEEFKDKYAEVMPNDYFAREGLHVASGGWWTWLARIYILLEVLFSIISVALDFTAEGPRVLKRVLSGIGLATTGLVTVFGLFKLASEDQHAIRNLIRGFLLIRNANQVAGMLSLSSSGELKAALSSTDFKHPIYADFNACALDKSQKLGTYVCQQMPIAEELTRYGWLVSDNICITPKVEIKEAIRTRNDTYHLKDNTGSWCALTHNNSQMKFGKTARIAIREELCSKGIQYPGH